jgi:hypothetical protein
MTVTYLANADTKWRLRIGADTFIDPAGTYVFDDTDPVCQAAVGDYEIFVDWVLGNSADCSTMTAEAYGELGQGEM